MLCTNAVLENVLKNAITFLIEKCIFLNPFFMQLCATKTWAKDFFYKMAKLDHVYCRLHMFTILPLLVTDSNKIEIKYRKVISKLIEKA